MNIMDKNNKHLYEKIETVLIYDQSWGVVTQKVLQESN